MKKGIKILIIILVIILVLGGGAFAYVYFATDMLKTDRQLFDKYISKNAEILDIFKDESIEAYNAKKQNTPYENEGKYYVTGMEKYLPENAKDMEITFKGDTDKANKYKYQKVKVNYNKDTSMYVDYINSEDYYGIKLGGIIKKYITIENKNLKDFAQTMGVNDLENIPDKIEFETVSSNLKFNEEEKEEIKNIIKKVLKENISEDKFSSSKEEAKVYTLDLTALEVMNTAKKVMEELSNNDLIMNRIKEIYKSQNNANDEEATKYIENLKEKITDYINKNVDEEDEKNLEKTHISISLYVESKQLIKTDITAYNTDYEDEKYNITINKDANKLNIEVKSYEQQEYKTQANIEIEKVKSEDELEYGILLQVGEYTNLKLSTKWTGLQDLERVGVQCTLQMDERDNQIKYVLTNQNTFVESINDKVEEDDLQLINGYNAEKLSQTIEKLQTAMKQLNDKKMEEIGVTDGTNPIIYYIPLLNQFIGIYTNSTNNSSVALNDEESRTSTIQTVDSAKQRVNAEWTTYYTKAQQEVSKDDSNITIKEYIINNWTVSSNPSLYSIKDGVITLAITNENGVYETGHINDNGQITWGE